MLEFFEKYEVCTYRELHAAQHLGFIILQAKVSDLDSRLSSVAQDKRKVNDRIGVLQENADRLNPNKKVSTSEIIRLDWEPVQ